MRRTTICRSSRIMAAVVVALPAAALLAAQDTTTVAPAAGSHVVARGETLWSISQQYFADPLLWPEIYRRNTSVVEDPHWIYPGEVLELGGIAAAPVDTTQTVAQGVADTGRADTIGAVPEPPPSEPEGPETIFDRRASKQQQVQEVLRRYAHQVYRPVRRGEFYSSGFLTEGENLPWAQVVGNTAKPAIPVLTDPGTAGQFAEVAIVPPSQASYHVGDSLLLARLDRKIDPWGDVVVPVGVARVTGVQEKQVLGQVIMQFGRIQGGNLALPLEPFKDPGAVRPAPIEQGLEGHLIAMRDEHVLASVQQVLFIDKGRSEGVTMGDVFEAYRPATGEIGARSEEVRVQLLVVHTREHTASVIVIGMSNPSLGSGMPVRLIKKMPS
ncbi:MAG TPA: LysM peptidoglycan-binding domain-containing protein [Gemmatimonadales bacterium]|nr:LysM peptidoglycan-binding domain-containing protein [Gemmatimonadales bacterium]